MESKNVRTQAKVNAANAFDGDNVLVSNCATLLASLRRWVLGTFVITLVMLILFVNWALPCDSDCERGDS